MVLKRIRLKPFDIGPISRNGGIMFANFILAANNRKPDSIQTVMNVVLSRQNISEMSKLIDLACLLRFKNIHFAEVYPNDVSTAEMAMTREDMESIDIVQLTQAASESSGNVIQFWERRLFPRSIVFSPGST